MIPLSALKTTYNSSPESQMLSMKGIEGKSLTLPAAQTFMQNMGDFAGSAINTGVINPIDTITGALSGGHLQIPHIPGHHSILGDLAGYAAPYGGIERGLGKAIEYAPKLAALLEKGLAGAVAREGLIGGSTGALTADQGHHLAGAEGGAAGSIVGAGAISPLARFISSPILRGGEASNIEHALQSEAPQMSHADVQRNAVNDIINKYTGLRKQANNAYGKVFDDSLPPMTKKDVPNFRKTLKTIHKRFHVVDMPDLAAGVKPPVAPPIPEPSPIIIPGESKIPPKAPPVPLQKYDPAHVNAQLSVLKQLSHQNGAPVDVNKYLAMKNAGKFRDSLQADMDGYLQKNGKLDAYHNANEFWKNKIVPYHDSPLFKRHIFPSIEAAKGDMEGAATTHFGNPHNELNDEGTASLKATAPVSQIANKLLPGGTESTDSSLANFTKLLDGDAGSAISHSRNLLFTKNYDHTDGTFDMKGLRKDLGNLKDENANKLLQPHEHAALKKLTELDKVKMPAHRRAVLMGALAAAGGMHFGGDMAAVGGTLGFGGGMALEHLAHPAISSFLESAPFRRMAALRDKLPPTAGSTLSSGIGSMMMGRNEK